MQCPCNVVPKIVNGIFLTIYQNQPTYQEHNLQVVPGLGTNFVRETEDINSEEEKVFKSRVQMTTLQTNIQE